MYSDCLPTSRSLISPCPWASLSPETQHIEIRPVSNPVMMVSQCSSKRKSPPSLTLSLKLDVIKLGEKGTLKAEIGWSQASCTSQRSCECKGKVFEGNYKCYSGEHTKTLRKPNSLVSVFWTEDQTPP